MTKDAVCITRLTAKYVGTKNACMACITRTDLQGTRSIVRILIRKWSELTAELDVYC